MVSCKPTVSCTMMGLYQWSCEFNPNPRRVTIAGSPATPQRDLNLRDCTQASSVTDAYKTGWVRKPSSTNWSRLVSSAVSHQKKRTASFLLVIPLPSFSATFQHLPMSSLSSPTRGYTWVLSASIHPNLITINHTAWLYIYIHIYIHIHIYIYIRIPSIITFRVKSLSVPTIRLPPWHFHHLAQLLHQLLPSLGAGRLL